MFIDALKNIWETSGLYAITWQQGVMMLVAAVLIYMAIGKKCEPLLLLPIAFGMLLSNLPIAGLYHSEIFAGGHVHWDILGGGSEAIAPGLLDYIYLGVKLGIFPCLIFMAVGAMTDFGPLISRPSSLFMGAGAQFGISFAFVMASFLGFTAARLPPSPSSVVRRPDSHLPDIETGSTSSLGNCYRSIFLHGIDPDHPAADHEGYGSEKTQKDQDEADPSGFQGRESMLPDHRYSCLHIDPAIRWPAPRYAHAG